MGPTGPETSAITTLRCVVFENGTGLKEITGYPTFLDLHSVLFFTVGPIGYPEAFVKKLQNA
jgi:hypothetical protein